MRFDCIIPTYNNLEELKLCLAGFATQLHTDFRVLICIDGSTDGTREWLEGQTFTFEHQVLEHPDRQNHGRNATRNLALTHLKADYLCFLDSDLVPEPQMLAAHANMLAKQDCISVGDVRYANAKDNVWSAYAQTRGKNKYRHAEQMPYYYLATGNCAHRARLFVELGGQDPLITRYGGGDTEYALRLHQRFGLPVCFNAESRAVGTMQKSLEEALQQLEEFGRTNLHYIHSKHPAERDIFLLRRLIGTSLSDRVFRVLLQPAMASLLQSLCGIAPTGLANRWINYCVMTRIYKGWKSGERAGLH